MSLQLAQDAIRATLPQKVENWTRIMGSWTRAGLEMYRPQAYVYFDFLRPTLVRNDFGAGKLRAAEAARDKGIVGEFYKKLHDLYYMLYRLDPTKTVDYLGDPERQQDFINFVLNNFISQINVQRSRAGTGNSTLSFEYNAPNDPALDPLHSIVRSFLDQLLTPNIHMEVWGVGRLNPDKVYPMFAGTTSVSSKSTTTKRTITVECEDYMKQLRISDVIVNPAFFNPELQKFDPKGLTITGNVFYGKSITKVISQLITGTGRGRTFGGIFDYDLLDNLKEIQQHLESQALSKSTFLQGSRKFRFPRKLILWGIDATPYRVFSIVNFPMVRSQIRGRYEVCRDVATRMFADFYVDAAGNFQFHPMRISSLFLVNPIIVSKTTANKVFRKVSRMEALTRRPYERSQISAQVGRSATSANSWINVSKEYAAARAAYPGRWSSLADREFTSRIKERIDSKVPASVYVGKIIERFYRVVHRNKTTVIRTSNPEYNPYIIPDAEILDLKEATSDKELITSLIMRGDNTLARLGLPAELAGLVGYRNNNRMIQQFGFRRKEVANPMFHGKGKGGQILRMFADAHYALINGEMNTANVSTPFTPERDVARPVCFPERNLLYYGNTITHTINVGSEGMTSTGMSFGRKLTDPDSINFFDHLVVTDRATADMSTAQIESKFRDYIKKQKELEGASAKDQKAAMEKVSNVRS